ncbi:hypothetical protein BV22DRAFT_1042222, partial [Leucogyrophana mollusca]
MDYTDPSIPDLFATQIVNYINTVSAAVVAYDQVLNFSKEVDLIWVDASGCRATLRTSSCW